ncbi:5-bromo-4-chloroindolyl phosphate hydrolysis family protein [Aerococcus urinaeequi]
MYRPLRYIAKLGQYPLYWPMNLPLLTLLLILDAPYYQIAFWIIALSFLVFIVKNSFCSNIAASKDYHGRYRLGRIPKSRKQIYDSANLTDQEIQFFRSEMAESLAHIETILNFENYNTHLDMVFKRYDMSILLKSYFQAITLAPYRLSQASDFLYQILPNLENVLKQYTNINQEMHRSPKKIQALTNLREEIANLAEQAQESFEHFIQDSK